MDTNMVEEFCHRIFGCLAVGDLAFVPDLHKQLCQRLE